MNNFEKKWWEEQSDIFRSRWNECLKICRNKMEALELFLSANFDIEVKKRIYEIKDTDWLRKADIPPYEWIVKELIPKNGITLLSARTGEGKTFLTLYMLLRISRGDAFFGCETKKTNCLLVEEEDSEALVKERLSLLGEGFFYYSHWQGFNLESETDINSLVTAVIDRKVGLIALDTYSRIHSKEETNEANRENYKALVDIMMRTGAAILLIHHNRKRVLGLSKTDVEVLRGGSDIGGMAEAVLVLETNKGQRDAQLENITKIHRAKMRATQNTATIEVRWGERDEKMEFAHSIVEDKISSAAKNAEKIRDFLEEREQGTYEEIEAVTGIPRSSIQRTIDILKNSGHEIIEKTENRKKVFKLGKTIDYGMV